MAAKIAQILRLSIASAIVLMVHHIPTYIPTMYLPTTYIHTTYVPTYLPTYVHTDIDCKLKRN